jgi:serine/threonine-protein kinase RsbT
MTRDANHVFVSIESDIDIIAARRRGRAMARKLGFTRREQTVIAAAISEVARNIIGRSASGQIGVCSVRARDRRGIEIVARDRGPRIADVERALQYGTSTGVIGTGLAGARLLMDQFQLRSRPSKGTLVTMRKWLASKTHS